MYQLLKHKVQLFAAIAVLVATICSVAPPVYAAQKCGTGDNAYTPVIDIGCTGKTSNPITDATFAIIRFLTNGVGLVIIGSIIYGGIQYSLSRGDPQAAAQAIHRIQSTLIALLIFIFSYAILNYVIPAGFLK